MAPIKAVLRSKLDKADTAKTLKELVDKYELLSDASTPEPSIDDPASDSEVDIGGLSPGQQLSQVDDERRGLSLSNQFLSMRGFSDCEPTSVSLQQLQMHFLRQLFCTQLQQLQTVATKRHHREPMDEQPLNLSFQRPVKRPAPQDADAESSTGASAVEVKRPCLESPPVSAPVTGQRRRKRSYRLSDNDEIRAFQSSAPELFSWDGHKPMIHQFLLKLLNNATCSGLIRWLDRDAGLFKVLQPGSVARLWQFIKGNRTDNYECFARGIRHSRDIGKYFEAHDFRKKKVYKFSEKAMRPATGQHQVETKAAPETATQQQQQLLLQRVQAGDLVCSASRSGSSDVLAKLKSALVERQQQQQQQQQQQMQSQVKLEFATVKDEPEDDESSLVIADCDY